MVCKWECQNVTVRDWWCKMHSQCCQSWPQSAKMYAAQPDIQDSWCALAFAHDFTEVTSYKLTSNNCKIKKKKLHGVQPALHTHTQTKMLISTLFQLKIHSCSDQRALTFTDTFGSHFSRACCNAKSLLGLRGRAVWGWMRGSLGKQKNDGKLLGDMHSVPVWSDTLRLWGLIPTHLFN